MNKFYKFLCALSGHSYKKILEEPSHFKVYMDVFTDDPYWHPLKVTFWQCMYCKKKRLGVDAPKSFYKYHEGINKARRMWENDDA